jgi:16S rRNA (cytosine1402-N4)-methyltransferase
MPKTNSKNQVHQPVLSDEVLHYLSPKAGESYLDLTAGYGGHAETVLALTGAKATLVDRDDQAIQALKKRFNRRAEILHSDFATISSELAAQGKRYDLILADLGVSSPHLEQADRGFSFSSSGPLDMRMDSSQELSADSIVNHASEEELVRILKSYGQEPKARTIARNIIARRPLKTTDELANAAAHAWPGHSKVHPATRTFQALRIAVNDELGQLNTALPRWLEILAPGGRMVVVSFHSLEDRLVKQFLADHSGNTYDAELILLTKKPITASAHEIISNPRARSAKLRAAAKIKK